jgi:cytochrome P450
MSPEQLRDPYPVYAQMRAEAPVFHDAERDLWVITRHADVLDVVRDPETFSSEGAVRTSVRPLPDEVTSALAQGWPLSPTLTDSDGLTHRRLRALVGQAFTPKRIAAMEPMLRRTVDELIDEFAPDGRADIIERFGWVLPLIAITEMLGVPREDVPTLHRWSYNWLRLMQATDPVPDLVTCAEDVVAMQRYFMAALEDRAANPRADLMSDLLQARVIGDDPLDMVEAMRVPMNLIIAGHVTVTRSIGNGLVALLAHPEQKQTVRDIPSLARTLVEEILRYESPAQGLFRTVRKDCTVGGVPIPAGARLMVHWGSANRDESVFERADEFDVTRDSTATHLAFGKGIHTCLGAPLARLQLQIAIPRLLERLPNLRLADGVEPERDTIFFARGFKKLVLAWDVDGQSAQ